MFLGSSFFFATRGIVYALQVIRNQPNNAITKNSGVTPEIITHAIFGLFLIARKANTHGVALHLIYKMEILNNFEVNIFAFMRIRRMLRCTTSLSLSCYTKHWSVVTEIALCYFISSSCFRFFVDLHSRNSISDSEQLSLESIFSCFHVFTCLHKVGKNEFRQLHKVHQNAISQISSRKCTDVKVT